MVSEVSTLAKPIGPRIREIRERPGMIQEEFNDGVSPINEKSLRRIESGELVNSELMTLLRIRKRRKVHRRELFPVDIPWQIKSIPDEIAKKKRKRRPKGLKSAVQFDRNIPGRLPAVDCLLQPSDQIWRFGLC